MKTTPILFNTEMVKALLEGRKTQTRRIVKDPRLQNNKNEFDEEDFLLTTVLEPIKTGDVLWVRETCRVGAWRDEDWEVAFDYKASPELNKTQWSDFGDYDRFQKLMDKTIDELDAMGIDREVDEENERFWYKWNPGESPLKWKPSIFMPKEACRIFLKVTDVRVERLQDISAKDAEAEGAKDYLKHDEMKKLSGLDWIVPSPFSEHQFGFLSIWCSINGVKSWEANPWVWVYEFERIGKPDNFLN